MRDSFRACGKSAHSLLTVATRARETEEEKGRRQGEDLNRQQIAGSERLKVRADVKSPFTPRYSFVLY